MVEILVALNVINNELYNLYRKEMTPLLKSYGGEFSYDFQIASVLKSKTDAPINRVFTIYFTDVESRDAFFSNEKYLKIKKKYFEASVSDTTIISTCLV